MINLPYVKVLEISADKVWEQIRKMDNINEISSFVSSVKWSGPKGVGGERVCISEDGITHFKEIITAFDDATRSYSYEVTEGVPAKNMTNTATVIDMGFNRSMIVWTSAFEFVANPQMSLGQFSDFLTTAREEMVANIVERIEK